MLVLFDSCGVEPRPDAVPVPIGEAYRQFLNSPRFSEADRKLIRERYREFAEGRGKDMWITVGKDTPFDILFWQHWSPNPGLSRIGRENWSDLERYVEDVLEASSPHSQVIGFDIMNEPGTLSDLPPGLSWDAAQTRLKEFIAHFSDYVQRRDPKAARTVGSGNLDDMKRFAPFQTLLSIHSYELGAELTRVLREALTFAQSQNKPIVLSECLANTDNWLKIHGEERLSTDEAQLRHYQEYLPVILKSGMGWYSWGGIAGRMFTPFTDILYPNGYRRPAAVYLEEQLKQRQ